MKIQMYRLLIIVSFIVIYFNSTPAISNSENINLTSFDFTTPNGSIQSLSDFNSKPILIEWGASWCTACDANIDTMKKIFPDYKDSVNFISLSYGGSGDNTDDLTSGAYAQGVNWPIGVDHTNKAKELNVANGFFTFLKPDLTTFKTYEYVALVASSQITQLRVDLNDLLVASGLEAIKIPQESNNGSFGVEFPPELLLLLGVVGIGGFAIIYNQKIQGNKNVDQKIAQSKEKQKNLIDDLKQVTNKNDSTTQITRKHQNKIKGRRR